MPAWSKALGSVAAIPQFLLFVYSRVAGGPSEQIQLELVQLCTTLIQHAHTRFQDHRKELIQFGW